jgi:hypothetical protein
VAPELVAALTALCAAAAAFLRAETQARKCQRDREYMRVHLNDVQAKVGADRRSGDRSVE